MREAISWYSSRLDDDIDPRYLNRSVPGRFLSMTIIVSESIVKKLSYSVSVLYRAITWTKIFNISFSWLQRVKLSTKIKKKLLIVFVVGGSLILSTY